MNLKDYRAFAGMQDRDFLVDHLTSLRAPPWEGLDRQSFNVCYSEIRLKLTNDPLLIQLFDRHLLAHRLIAGNQTPGWVVDTMDRHIDAEKHLPGIGCQACLNGRWTGIPTPMVSAGRGRLRWFVVGAVVGSPRAMLWPPWATPMMDNHSQSAAKSAARAACKNTPLGRKTSLFLFPLAVANDQCQFHGTSLGLSLAIGFMKALTRAPVSSRLVATGAISEDATVGSVDGLSEKRIAAGKKGFSLFIYPAASHPLPLIDGMETLQVADLRQAWMVARWYRPGNGNQLALLSHMVDDAHAFVANMNSVDSIWVDCLATEDALTPVIKTIVTSPDLFSRYLSNIDNQLDEWRLDDAAIHMKLVSREPLDQASTTSPLSAFRYFKAALILANHRGDVNAAKSAADQADQMFAQAMHGNLDLCADYLNHRQVARHNRFHFSPGLGNQLKRVLAVLEARHQVQCEFGCPTDPTLARIYGTIAQNYGFCGPRHLTQTMRYAGKAINAFGSSEVPEYQQDVRRQHAHLMYAHLDAGDNSAARESLFAFLAVENWDQIEQMREARRLTHWHHAALARFLADTGRHDQAAGYLKWCQHQATIFDGTDHPRQLWAFNLGRMARSLGQISTAEKFFKQSLSLCFKHENRPTLFVMALLPLTALDSMDQVTSDNALIKIVDTARNLNADHFKDLLDVDEKTLPKRLRTAPERYFPFSYR